MPSLVQSRSAFPRSLEFKRPAEMSRPRDEGLSSREPSVSKLPVPVPISAALKGVKAVNEHCGYDWIAGVGDICCPSGERRQSPNYDNSSRVETRGSELAEFAVSFHDEDARKVTGPSRPVLNRKSTNTKRSALQRHCDFWDADQDGVIYPWDIFVGFRRLGFNIALCIWAAVTMCMCSSYSTQTSWIPHPMFAINLDKIDCCRHGSTTGAYDLDAELDLNRFEAIFRKYAEGKDYLTLRTMYKVWRGQCCANDFFGWFAGGLEWVALYILLWPQDGRLRKQDIQGVYDGSIFFEIAKARA
ncbi:hypothetical protein IAQ61_003622 [Plenodomus lingam]|uniref:Caleosin domain containing protein n=1 Tax=Leptosphaeria maculans (strain JN3 / isolate v23.1.3 / race Av1-4-5-6-7-8) TaxID=985895 RepID=E4ZR70_LEPMJ|nr:hypothetical protein LEMA_P034090.1 [Plenodomus lingam JN3]KAH9874433.1 hypothetical protein IAQ61_003622 [Plenodomus lingam]CBX93735.1 hypothetical protein LEMA_P034090.1 [Plenodomus lingam JN3]